MKTTLKNHMPTKIVEKFVEYNEEGNEISREYKQVKEPIGASYYWLVEFGNGKRIPYPLMNLEGENTSAYKFGDMGLSEEEKEKVRTNEEIIRHYYEERPELEKAFLSLRDKIFE